MSCEASGQERLMRSSVPAPWTRERLYAVLDQYLSALADRDPARVRWSDAAFVTENNVQLTVGDGLWGTVTALGDYDLRFADVRTGQVGLFTTAQETSHVSGMTVRIAVDRDDRIREVETLIVRQVDEALVFPNPRFDRKPVLEAFVPDEQRMTRERLVAIADGYFSTLEQNDGTLFTRFHADCQRVENGVQTTNNANFPLVNAKLGCEEQFRLGYYRYDDRLRARRFPLIDEERGLVLAHAFIDHRGRLDAYRLTDGTEMRSHIRRPHSFYLAELFKIEAGAIRQIEANFITVPYHMPSPWDDAVPAPGGHGRGAG